MILELWPSGRLYMSRNTVPLLVQSAYGSDGYFDVVLYWSFSWGSGTYGSEPLAVQRLYADEAGYIELDMQRIVNDAFLDRFHIPFTVDSPSQIIFADAHLVISESYAGAVIETNEYYFSVWHGGVPRPARDWKHPMDFAAYVETNKKWLTSKPNNCKVSKAQDEFLYHLNGDGAVASVTYHFTLTDDNNTDYTLDVDVATSGVDHDIMLANVGYNNNDLDDLLAADRYPVFYKVVAYETGNISNIIAEERTYIVDLKYQPFEKLVYFSNSLGCMDCLRLVGEGTPQTSYEDVDVDNQVSLRTNTSRWASTGARLESKETESNKKLTGWISKEEWQWLRDLRLSQNVLLYDSDGYHIPIRLTKKEFPLPKENDDLFAFSLEYELIEKQSTYALPHTAYYLP